MAEQFTNPNDIVNNTLGSANDSAQGAIDSVTNQIPDVPNPEDLIPEIPKIPDISGLIGSLPLPQFRKPEPVKVPKPKLPKKLQKKSKIKKVPKE